MNQQEIDRLELGQGPAEAAGFENAPWPIYRHAHLKFPTSQNRGPR